MAPEILLKLGYSKAVDIYSCAIVMYTLFTMG
jgi:serine/threonine protein kinase